MTTYQNQLDSYEQEETKRILANMNGQIKVAEKAIYDMVEKSKHMAYGFRDMLADSKYRPLMVAGKQFCDQYVAVYVEEIGNDMCIDILITNIDSKEFMFMVNMCELKNTTTQTGTIGLKGLRFVLNQLPDLVEYTKKRGLKRLVAMPSNDKRSSAYRYLLKIGFKYDEEEDAYYKTV